jgi:hypothetical protein
MAALVAAIHVFLPSVGPKSWMAGTSPAMTAIARFGDQPFSPAAGPST